MADFGLYIHIPFCRSKCPYCGFVSIVNGNEFFRKYAYAAEYELSRRNRGVFEGSPVTAYIGGGTPSCYPVELLKTIVGDTLKDTFEATIEANPESVDGEWLNAVLGMGINRISIGVQSFDDTLLSTLGRIHSAATAIRAVETAWSAGFRRISVDLMFGIPGQSMDTWSHTLSIATELPVEHISCYSLSLEEDTPFLERFAGRNANIPAPELTVAMYRHLNDVLAEKGFLRYELSNFSLPDAECIHNTRYWSRKPYIGIGTGAHSFDGLRRMWNHDTLEKYCDIQFCQQAGEEVIDERTCALETLMLSLRMNNGIDVEEFAERDAREPAFFLNLIQEFIHKGFLEKVDSSRTRIAVSGVMMADEIIAELAAELK